MCLYRATPLRWQTMFGMSSRRRVATALTGVGFALVLSGCSSSTPTAQPTTPPVAEATDTADVAATGVTDLSEAELTARDTDLASVVVGETAQPLIASLYLDLVKMKSGDQAAASTGTNHMFVITTLADEAGVLTIEGTPAKLPIAERSIGSLAFRFARAGEFRVVFTSSVGQPRAVATITVK